MNKAAKVIGGLHRIEIGALQRPAKTVEGA